jgi:hypothetical protein
LEVKNHGSTKIAEIFSEYFVDIAENFKRQNKNNHVNDNNVNLDGHTHSMEQAFNKPYTSMECKCTTTKEF